MILDDSSVEALISSIKNLNLDSRATFELWVPEELTLNGEPVRQDVAMALILDHVLHKGFGPDGFIEGEGGRTYKYRLFSGFDELTR